MESDTELSAEDTILVPEVAAEAEAAADSEQEQAQEQAQKPAPAPAFSTEEAPPPSPRRLTRGRIALGVLLCALLAAGSVLLALASGLRSGADTRNRAVTDQAATATVSGAVSSALTTLFSYTPSSLADTRAAAAGLLDGRALTQYQALVGRIGGQVASQKLTVSTRVVASGVSSLTGDTAHLLVFLDQLSSRAGASSAPAAAASELSVTAVLEKGSWRITQMTLR